MLAILKEKEAVARTMAKDARATLHSLIDPDYFENQAEAAAEAQKRLDAILNELGPTLFPGTPRKEEPKAESDKERDKKKL